MLSGYISNNYMSYYWSSTCHYSETYETDTYSSNDLKEIDNYKIRLITTDELSTNLGWRSLDKYATDADNSNVPTWVYQNFGTNAYAYWTMTPDANNSSTVRYVSSDGKVYHSYVRFIYHGVRPVINLLKSNIPAQS